MLVQCSTCILKYNDETVNTCRVCHPKKRKNGLARRRQSKKHWEKVALRGSKRKMLEETQVLPSLKSHDYFAKGKRKDFPM